METSVCCTEFPRIEQNHPTPISSVDDALGMSFLSNFKFEINSGDKTLKLLRVDAD